MLDMMDLESSAEMSRLPSRKTFCSLFRETAQLYANHTAVVCENKQITYRELDEQSDCMACELLGKGVKREDIIAIAMGRSIETVVAMIGIWKAGATYTYLNTSLPPDQVQNQLQDCRCPCVIDQSFWQEISIQGKAPACIDFSAPESLATLVFTSGTMAKPKGVMIEHRNISAMINNTKCFELTSSDSVCVFPSFSFIASASDLFPSLLTGAAVYIIEETQRRNIHKIIDYFIHNKITVSFLPPHMAIRFLHEEQDQTCLRLLLVGSEHVRNLSPQRYKIMNVYGASELCSLISQYSVQDTRKSYPVGKLQGDLRGYIVDEHGHTVPAGQEGELWLSGSQISRGYYDNPQKTAEHYCLNPFAFEPGYERVFKTGDIVRELVDGNLQYIARKDNMCKIRGYRVEMGAVEAALLLYNTVQEAVVRAWSDSGGCNILCGYFVAEETLDPKEVKAFLRQHLPYYMVPSCLIQMPEFPRSTNNKIMRGKFLPPAEINDHKLLEKLY